MLKNSNVRIDLSTDACGNLEDTKILRVAICYLPRTFKVKLALPACALDYKRTRHVYDFLKSPCTWHDEGFGLTGVRRSSSNGTYLPEQVPLALERRSRRYNAPPARLSMQIPASWPGYYPCGLLGCGIPVLWNFRKHIIAFAYDFFLRRPVTSKVFNSSMSLQDIEFVIL